MVCIIFGMLKKRRKQFTSCLKRSKQCYEENRLMMSQEKTMRKDNNVWESQTHCSDTSEIAEQLDKTTHQPTIVMRNPNEAVNREKAPVTPSLTHKLTEYINYDLEQSTSHIQTTQHSYKTGISRITSCSTHPLPPIIEELYDKQVRMNAEVCFKYGLLQLSGYCYYAINDQLVLIDAWQVANTPHPDYQALEVKDVVYCVKEVHDQGKLFATKQTLVIVAHPWELEFYMWDQQGGRKLRRMNLIMRLSVDIVTHIDYMSNGTIYYFDHSGLLHQLVPEQIKHMFFLHTGRYALKHYVSATPNTQERLHKKGLFSFFHRLINTVNNSIKSFYSFRVKVRCMFCDRKRHLLIGLLEKTTFTFVRREIEQFIVCYRIEGKKAKLVTNISESSLEEELKHFFRFSQRPRIHSIHGTNVNQVKKANVIILLESGGRVLMDATATGFKFIQFLPSPKNNLNFVATRKSKSPHEESQMRLLCGLDESGKGMFMFSTSGTEEKVMFFTHRINNVAESSHKQYLTSFTSKPIQNPFQVQIHRLNHETMMDFYARHNLQLSSHTYRLSNLHELAEQPLSPPTYYLILTNTTIQCFAHTRPIDVVFTVLWMFQGTRATIHALKILKELFFGRKMESGSSNVDGLELATMLLQLYVDKAGSYLFSKEVIVGLIGFWKDMEHTSKPSYPSISYQDKVPNSTISNELAKHKNSNNRKINYKQFSQAFVEYLYEFYELVCQNHSQMPKKRRKKGEYLAEGRQEEDEFAEFCTQTMLLYCSRIARPVWKEKIGKLGIPQITFLKGKLECLTQLAIKIKQNNCLKEGQDPILQQSQKFLQAFLSLVRAIECLPILPNRILCEALTSQMGFLEPFIFDSIVQHYNAGIIKKWNKMFPEYISPKLTKLIIMYEGIDSLTSKQQIVKQMKQAKLQVPQYFVTYLIENKNITRFQVLEYLQRTNEADTTIIGIPHSLSQVLKDRELSDEKVIEGIERQLTLQTVNIERKYKLLPYIHDKLREDIKKGKRYINLKNRIVIQHQIFHRYRQQNKHCEEDLMKMIEYNCISYEQLYTLIKAINKPLLLALFCALTNDSRLCLSDILSQHYGKEFEEKGEQVREEIKKDILYLGEKTGYKVNLDELLGGIEKVIIKFTPIATTLSTWVQFKKRVEVDESMFWLCQLLIRIGYSPSELLESYLRQIKSIFDPFQQLSGQHQLCYQFLSCNFLICEYERWRKDDFMKETQHIIQLLSQNQCVSQIQRVGILAMVQNTS